MQSITKAWLGLMLMAVMLLQVFTNDMILRIEPDFMLKVVIVVSGTGGIAVMIIDLLGSMGRKKNV